MCSRKWDSPVSPDFSSLDPTLYQIMLETMGSVLLSTSNGRIVLELPEETDADVDLQVENGHIRNDIHLTDPAGHANDHVRGRIGSGGTPIRLRTSNGTISLR